MIVLNLEVARLLMSSHEKTAKETTKVLVRKGARPECPCVVSCEFLLLEVARQVNHKDQLFLSHRLFRCL
jgi:hypothetical protein